MPEHQKIEPVPEMEEMAKRWYNTDAIAFELVNSMKFRETVFIDVRNKIVQRLLKINAVRFIYKNFERYDFYNPDKLYNVYSSVAYFHNLPMFSFNQTEKTEQQAKFNANYNDYITGYDLFIDLDNKELELVYSSTKRLKDIFDSYQIPYTLTFSGSKGFHISVDYNDLPTKLKKLNPKQLSIIFKLFAYELKITKKIKDIDTSIFDMRRIRKVPYSIVYPYYYVALPLSDKEFDNFSLENVFLPNVVDKAEQFKRRGVMKRQGIHEKFLYLLRDLANERKKSDNLFKLFKNNRRTLYGLMQEMELIEDD